MDSILKMRNLFLLALLYFFGAMSSSAAISFVSASATSCVNSASATSSITCTLAASTTANNTVFAVLAIRTTTSTGSTITDSGGSAWALISGTASNNGTSDRVELWATTVGGAKASTSVTPTLSAGSKFVISVIEYSGVQSLGNTTATTGGVANPTVSVTTQDNNNFCVGGFTGLGGTNTFTGVDTSAITSGNANLSNVGGASSHNSVASPGTCTSSATNADTVWALDAVELRTVAPSCAAGSKIALLGAGCT